MRKLVVFEWITLDGVFDAQTMGTWFAPYDSPARQQYISECINGCGCFLFGRKTYEMLAPYWSSLKNNEMGVAGKLNSGTKYVASTTLKTPVWENTVILKEAVPEEVSKLKQQPGGYILVEGSGQLAASLAQHGLVDEYRLLAHPVIMGSGERFFAGNDITKLKLTQNTAMDNGVMLMVYEAVK